jgi:hypothetical protein
LQLIQLPGTPLRRMAVFPVLSRVCIQSQNLGGKPLCFSILISDSQLMESRPLQNLVWWLLWARCVCDSSLGCQPRTQSFRQYLLRV